MTTASSVNLKRLKGAYQVCHDCGIKYGEVRNTVSSYWHDKCDVCGAETSVTEARDYGFLWKGIRDLEGKSEEEVTVKKPKYVTQLQTITIENTENPGASGLTEIHLNDEGGGRYITLQQDGQEISLDPEEIDLIFDACKKLLNQ